MPSIIRDTIYIDGSWVASGGRGTIPVINSTTEETMGTIPDGVAGDVDGAVAAARRAFPGWAATSPEERAKFCSRIAEGLQARTDEIATLVSQEVGMVKPLSVIVELVAPFVTDTPTTVPSEATAVTFETAPPMPRAVAVIVVEAPLSRYTVGPEEIVSDAGTYGTSAPVAESNTVAPVPSLITRFVIVAFTLLNEIAG